MLRGAGGHCELGEGKGAAWGRLVSSPFLPQGVLGGVGGHRDQLHRLVLVGVACHSEPEGEEESWVDLFCRQLCHSEHQEGFAVISGFEGGGGHGE
jgi:hypothetical protein